MKIAMMLFLLLPFTQKCERECNYCLTDADKQFLEHVKQSVPLPPSGHVLLAKQNLQLTIGLCKLTDQVYMVSNDDTWDIPKLCVFLRAKYGVVGSR